MEPIPLNPGPYDGTYKLIGGTPSLDFVNTVSWSDTARRHDWLDRAENLTRWAAAAGLINAATAQALDARPPTVQARELLEAGRLRDGLREVLWPLGHAGQPAADAIHALNAQLRVAGLRRLIDPHTCRWSWMPPATFMEMLAPVVWDAARVLTEVDPARVGHCPACDWLFVDSTRNRSRRWCDMGDCGSRDKSLRYYHRTKATDDSR